MDYYAESINSLSYELILLYNKLDKLKPRTKEFKETKKEINNLEQLLFIL